MKLILATHNADKVKEIKQVLDALSGSIEIYSASEFPDLTPAEETEPTLEGNALKKAKHIYDHLKDHYSQLLVMADDTGLEVEALNGEPGVYSARYASDITPNPTYNDNVEKLIRAMSGVAERDACFRTVIALIGNLNFGKQVSGSYFEKTFEGKAPGEITEQTCGTGGFGYDPIFKLAGSEKTFAELSLEEKNQVSHRGKALQQLACFLKEILDCE